MSNKKNTERARHVEISLEILHSPGGDRKKKNSRSYLAVSLRLKPGGIAHTCNYLELGRQR